MTDPTKTYVQPPDHVQRISKAAVTVAYTEGYKRALLGVLTSLPAMQGLSGAEVLKRIKRELESQIKELE